jgi:DNA polymerase I-like protein with 3'-5' exonuclease and polymerase domains
MFIPDPGHTICEADLAGADARVVAWRARDEDLMRAFESGVKIHVHNGTAIFGRDKMYSRSNSGKSEPYYTRVKKGVHATNYGATVGAAKRCGMTKTEFSEFQSTWFRLHPAILEWHKETDHNLQVDRTVRNPFGYSITYFDRPGNCFTNALAWEPSSVVAEVTFIAMRRIHRQYRGLIQLLLQVHDSLVMQIPTRVLGPTLRSLHGMLNEIVVPYPTPLIIPWDIKLSTESWGQTKEASWEQAA